MCLYTKQTKPLIAKKDIKVYKVLKAVFDKTNDNIIYYTSALFYKRFHYGINTPNRPENFIEKNTFLDINNGDFFLFGQGIKTKIEGGWLHAFIGKLDAKMLENFGFINYDDNSCYYKFICAEMTIPKGAKYFIGIKGDICSDMLVWNENDPVVWAK